MRFTALLLLTLISILWTQTASIVMKAAVGETITVECPQATQQKHHEIWWCKKTSYNYCNQISSIDGARVWNGYARTSIANTNGNIFVTIQQLQKTDTGTYWCGPQQHNILRPLDVIVLEVFSVLWTQTASIVMKAAVGETITVECPQATQQKHQEIWWCKITSETRCNHIPIIDGDRVWNVDARTSITNTNGNISLTIQQLEETDAGTYWCGSRYQNTLHALDVVILKVFSGRWEPILSEVSGVVGNAATIPCLFTEKERLYQKFLCKATSVNKCIIIASSNGVPENRNNGNVSITIDNSYNFIVTMNNIDKGNEGEYWCGAEKINDIKIVAIRNLTITEGNSEVPSNGQSKISSLEWYIILTVVPGLLILLLLVLFIFRKKMQKSARDQGKNENENAEPQILVTKFDREAEDMITYSTVGIQTPAQRGENSTIYANLKNTKAQKASIVVNSSESVEYSTLMFGSKCNDDTIPKQDSINIES
ncbi:polymeric immunoglobulin receptor-like isoform X1 [Mustelus asterias]